MSKRVASKKSTTKKRQEKVVVMQDTIMLDYLIHTGYQTFKDKDSGKICIQGLRKERRTAWRESGRAAIGELLEKEPLKTSTESDS